MMNRKRAVKVAAAPAEVFPIKTFLAALALALALLSLPGVGHG
jgi:hypothetical protein